jgi:hypothetical protein
LKRVEYNASHQICSRIWLILPWQSLMNWHL